jgi:hypothetical protein
MTEPTSRASLSAAILTIGGIGAASAAASCRGLPFLLASTGIGFAWLTGLAIFSRHTDRFCLPVRRYVSSGRHVAVATAEGCAGLRR